MSEQKENRYFQVKLTESIEVESKNGDLKIKKIKYTYIVYTNSVGNAEKLINQYAKNLFTDYEINSINDSRIIGVINQNGEIVEH